MSGMAASVGSSTAKTTRTPASSHARRLSASSASTAGCPHIRLSPPSASEAACEQAQGLLALRRAQQPLHPPQRFGQRPTLVARSPRLALGSLPTRALRLKPLSRDAGPLARELPSLSRAQDAHERQIGRRAGDARTGNSGREGHGKAVEQDRRGQKRHDGQLARRNQDRGNAAFRRRQPRTKRVEYKHARQRRKRKRHEDRAHRRASPSPDSHAARRSAASMRARPNSPRSVSSSMVCS